MSKNTLLVAGLIIGALGAGFIGGMKFQERKLAGSRSNFATFRNNGNGDRGVGTVNGRGMGFRPVFGEVIASDSGSLTIKLSDGSSKIILVSDSTVVSKSDVGSKSDLVMGAKVTVFGNEANAGTITATNISLGENQFRLMVSPTK